MKYKTPPMMKLKMIKIFYKNKITPLMMKLKKIKVFYMKTI